MDVNYTDTNRIDQGALQGFAIDFDTADSKDFEITVGIDNNVLQGNSYWYIEGTEYGGIVDEITVNTESNQITYVGRNFRGMLGSKIISPPPGEDYRIVYGNIAEVTKSLLIDSNIQDIFSVQRCNVNLSSYRFKRYTDLYSGLVDLAYSCGKVIALTARMGKRGSQSCLDKVMISFVDRFDYSGDIEYTGADIKFLITKGYNAVNHLICLGKGELKDRLVAHLYVDGDGDIVEKQYYFGIDEIVATYDLSSEESLEELKKQGASKLGEMMSKDSFEVTAPEIELKIGDVIGGYEKVTGYTVRREIVNIIAKIDDQKMEFDYTVGGDEPGAASIPSEIVPEYILPIASATILGGIKTGTTLSMASGVLRSDDLTDFKQKLEEANEICA